MKGSSPRGDDRIPRRRLLQAAAGVALLSGCQTLERRPQGTETEAPPTTGGDRGTSTTTPGRLEHRGITFDRVVDGVDDLGFDNTGEEPIDYAFADAYRTGTLIELPPGEYLVDEGRVGQDVSRFGLRGTGDTRRGVRITPTSGSALKWIQAIDAGPHLIENLSFDERSDDTTQLSLLLRTTGGSAVSNVEWLGRTPDDSVNQFTLAAECIDVDGVITLDRIYTGLDEPAKPVDYPDGVEFIRAGPAHKGEVVLREPVIHGRNSSATRYTRPSGVLTIVGGEFVNNQNTSIRFGAGDHPSKVSSATGCYVRVGEESEGTTDAVRVDASRQGYSGAIFDGITVEWQKSNGRGVITFPEWGGHGSARFSDCVVYNGGEQTPTVEAAAVSEGNEVVEPEEKAVRIENCSFTGPGGGFICMDRPKSTIVDSCIDMPNAVVRGFETTDISRTDCRRPSR